MSGKPLLIAGLGNPGSRYARTRHNIGFRAVDRLAESLGATVDQKKWKSHYVVARWRGVDLERDLVLIKPQDFMNNSGECIAPAMKFYKVAPAQMLALHDESELPFGEMRFKLGGGHKGHNGLRDIIDQGGSADFHRLRLGVGRPEDRGLADYLLAKFSDEQESALPEMLDRALKMIELWIAEQAP